MSIPPRFQPSSPRRPSHNSLIPRTDPFIPRTDPFTTFTIFHQRASAQVDEATTGNALENKPPAPMNRNEPYYDPLHGDEAIELSRFR